MALQLLSETFERTESCGHSGVAFPSFKSSPDIPGLDHDLASPVSNRSEVSTEADK
jgi:hypothetical protein